MKKHNAENERIKHRYRIWMQDARGYSVTSIDKALAAIRDYETFTKHKPFRLFHIKQARAYVRDLKKRKNPKTGKLYSKSSISSTLAALRKFVEWLGGQSEFRRRISYGDADYFRLSEKDERIARATRPKRIPSLEDVRGVILDMPSGSDTEKRDRAIIAFNFMAGARVAAIASAKLKHIDPFVESFFQDARDVKDQAVEDIHHLVSSGRGRHHKHLRRLDALPERRKRVQTGRSDISRPGDGAR